MLMEDVAISQTAEKIYKSGVTDLVLDSYRRYLK